MSLALLGGRIFLSPNDEPIENGIVLIDRGKISRVGTLKNISIPGDARKIDCSGLSIAAGFQNSHVHLLGDLPELSAQVLGAQIRDSFTQYGFTTIVDTGSYLPSTINLHSRIESGEIPGPRIFTAGSPIYPVDGIPSISISLRRLIKCSPSPKRPTKREELSVKMSRPAPTLSNSSRVLL